jgi:ribonucleoside-diphosphate reductase alpha chain
MKIVNQTVPMALRKLGTRLRRSTRLSTTSTAPETIEGAPALKESHLPVFDCAFKATRATGRFTTWATSR